MVGLNVLKLISKELKVRLKSAHHLIYQTIGLLKKKKKKKSKHF